MKTKKGDKVVIGDKTINLFSSNVEELRGFLAEIDSQERTFREVKGRVLRMINRREKSKIKEKIEYKIAVETENIGLPIFPVISAEGVPIGDVNLLMNQVEIVSSPFDGIISNIAKDLINKISGLLPDMGIQSVKKLDDSEVKRMIVKWNLKRSISQEEIYAIAEVSKLVYEQQVYNSRKINWEPVKYQNIYAAGVPGKYSIYFGPQNHFHSAVTGVIISRKFPSAAEAKFLIQTRPGDWIASSASGSAAITTEVEIREGPKNDKDPSISQENFLELVIQISYLLANQKLIDRRILMATVFKELNKVGTISIDREKLFGMKSVLEVIERVLLFPLQQPDLAKNVGFIAESILLVGVPGVGKTKLAHFLMTGAYNAIFASVDSSRLHQELVEGSQTGASYMLLKIDKIKEITSLPVIPLIDDIDVALGDEKINSKFLNLMQGIREKGLYLLASTNHPEKIDERLLEPGRLSKIIHVPLPTLEDRKGVLRAHLTNRPFESKSQKEEIINKMAETTDGWTQRFLWELCGEAARLCGLEIVAGNISQKLDLANCSVQLKISHFEKAKADLDKSINLKRIKKRDEEIQEFISHRSKIPGFMSPQ